MKEVQEFFSGLLEAESWPARWVCGKWTSFHGWLYISSNVAIGAAYFAIPLVIYIIMKRRDADLPFKGILWLFILFILACGTSHFMDILMFWYPAYRSSAIILLITAIISWVTVIGLIKILPNALSFKSPLQLELIITERTSALEVSNLHLKKLHDDLDEFVYSASHDLKSPVNNIEGLLSMMEEGIQNDSNTEKEIIRRLHLSVSRIKGTIGKLTDIAKMQRSPLDDIKKLYFSEMINEVLDEHWNFMTMAGKEQPVIQSDLEVSFIYYSHTVLKSILYNLVSNSFKYSSSERPLIIKIKTFFENDKVILTVEDNGLGIDLSLNKDKMFTLFKRFHDHVEGTGIGLYAIKKMIEQMNGSIEVFSELNKGTLFKVQF